MQKKRTYTAGLILLLLCILAGILYVQTRPETAAGQKALTVVVVHGDGEEKTFDYTTDAEYLGQVLEENQLASGTEGAYGTFITTVDGETADEAKEQWWCITKEGEMVSTSADQAPITDGDQYELTLKEGY